MGAPKPARRRWVNVPIQADLRERAQRRVDGPNNPGYNSVADLTNEALRRRLDELDVQHRAADVGERLDHLKAESDRAAAKVRLGGPRGKFCHKCGKVLVADAAFCSSCGTPVG